MPLHFPRVIALLSALAAGSALLFASPVQPLLPPSFGGWHETGAPQRSTSPQAADANNAEVLREYGMKQFASANYIRANDQVVIRALRFPDATGAFGAFTFYRATLHLTGKLRTEIGQESASEDGHVLFWSGVTLIDATFSHFSPADAGQLQTLASALPKATGGQAVLPPLLNFLPVSSLDKNSVRYSIGPAAYTRSGGVLPPSLADFSSDAEAITANYAIAGHKGTLTLLNYPTPQLALSREQAIAAFLKAGNAQAAWPLPLAQSNPASLQTRRSGPLVAITSGGFTAAEAQKLLAGLHYTANITWNHPQGYISEGAKTARVLLSIAYLTIVLCSIAVLLGIFLGGGRALVRKLQGKPLSSMSDDYFISLNLKD